MGIMAGRRSREQDKLSEAQEKRAVKKGKKAPKAVSKEEPKKEVPKKAE